jgi:uncharacterized protein
MGKMKASKLFTNKDQDESLYIDKSTLPGAGKGLFTKKTIKKDEIICYFSGELIDEEEAEIRDVGIRGHYFVQLASGKILDTYHASSFGKWVNDAKDKRKNNGKIYTTLSGKRAYISATKTIQPGSEIFVDYGKQYWADIKQA